MAIAETAAPRFEMGRVVSRTFSVIGKNIGSFLLLAILAGLTWSAAAVAANQLSTEIEAGRFPATNTILLLAIWAILYLGSAMLLQGGVIHGAVALLNGKRASVAECLATGLKYLWPLFLIGLLETLGIVAGFVALIVPGIILSVMWVSVGPACVVERTGISGAFSRSAELTSGCRWPIFGLYVAYTVFILIFALVMGFLIGLLIGIGMLALTRDPAAIQLATTSNATELVVTGINTMVSLIVGSAFSASVYYELREIKEGIGPEALASVFD